MFRKMDKFSRVQKENTLNYRMKKELRRTFQQDGFNTERLPTQSAQETYAINDEQEEEKREKKKKIIKSEEQKTCCEGFNMTSFVLLIALSTHAIFEGIALGLTEAFAPSLNIMIGLSIHKIAGSMSLGISFAKNFENED